MKVKLIIVFIRNGRESASRSQEREGRLRHPCDRIPQAAAGGYAVIFAPKLT
jgi:hypothetical protein